MKESDIDSIYSKIESIVEEAKIEESEEDIQNEKTITQEELKKRS